MLESGQLVIILCNDSGMVLLFVKWGHPDNISITVARQQKDIF